MDVSEEGYDQKVAHLQKKQDWTELERYCRRVERRLRNSIRDGTATEEDHRLRLQALLDLQTTYVILAKPREQLRAAQEAHRALRQAPITPDVLNDYYSYTSLAKAHTANNQPEQTREMFLCAGASMITRRQAEFLGNALLDLAACEREQDASSVADVIEKLAEGLKRASKKVHRTTRKSPPVDG